jgi:hypothetical protein
MRWIIVIGLFCLSSASVSAGEVDSDKMVDLGEISVMGEVRRPNLLWIDSQKSVRELLPEIIKSEYEAYTKELLEPAKVEKGTKD